MLHRLATHVRRNAVAYAALFVALGGTSYAAVRIPASSVGERQLKPRAVTASKLAPSAVTSASVRDGSLLARDFGAGQLPRGDQGPPGAPGATGATGATGPPGEPGPGARWVIARGDGTILAQSGGLTVHRHSAGNYIVDFGESAQGKALLVSIHDDGFLTGAAGIAACGGAPWRDCSFAGPQYNEPSMAFVFTSNPANSALADHAFTAVLLRQ